MSDPAFVAEQFALIHEPHIAPVTDFIDSLQTPDLWLPYVAPHHAGVGARMLTVLRDPGPATRVDGGSGMLSVENDDPTAEKQFEMMTSVGLTSADFTPWNAYPWYINRAPTNDELRDASPSLVGLLDLLPDLELVLLQGNEARSAWRIALDEQPAIRRRRLITLETYHASPQALWHKSPNERARRTQHRSDTWREAAEILHE
jgi:hypothetical protein